MDLPQRLYGTVAFVTGGSRGFGRATAIRLAGEGADVALCYRNAPDAAEAVRLEIEALGRKAFVTRADVADEAQARSAVRAVVDHFGRLDVLVNNAGIRHIGPFAGQDSPLWREMIDVNMWGPMSTIHEALPGMIERGSGCIVNLSSQQAHVGWEDFAVYAATKAFLLALTKSIAREVGRYGITVNAVCPGSIVTDMNRTSDPEGRARRAATEIPLRRTGDPADVAAAVAYLASPDGGFVTGQCIDVNGGLVTA